MAKTKLNVKGMHCKGCEMLIKDVLSDEKGVKKADVSLKDNTVSIDYDESKTDLKRIKEMISKEGYEVV